MSTETRFVCDSGSDQEKLEAKRLPTGVWTPWAEIRCVECVDTSHPMWKGDPVAISNLRPREHGESEATCDKCGAKIWVWTELAAEQRLVKALVKLGIPARMQQTGGMCSAAEVWKADESAYIMATEMGEGEQIGAVYCVGLYHGDPDDGYDDGEYFEMLDFDGAISKVSELWGNFQN